jgi:hypothetical protein
MTYPQDIGLKLNLTSGLKTVVIAGFFIFMLLGELG